MSDAVAAVAAPAAPAPSAPSGGAQPPAPSAIFTPKPAPAPTPTPSGGGAPAPDVAPLSSAERIELSKLPPTARVVLNIDGQDTELSAAEASKLLSRNGSANKRFEEAAEQRRQHAKEKAEFEQYQRDFASALSNPANLRKELAELGLSPREIASALLRIEEDEAAMTPEQRRIRELEQREADRDREGKEAEQRAYEEKRAGFREAYRGAFNEVMTGCGIPADHVSRDILMPTLSRAAQYVQQTEGRMITKAEARRVVEHAVSQMGTLRQPTEADRLAAITDADYEAYAKRKREARAQAAPPIARDAPRHQDGRFAPRDQQQQRPSEPRRNINGEIMVDRMSSRWGNKM